MIGTRNSTVSMINNSMVFSLFSVDLVVASVLSVGNVTLCNLIILCKLHMLDKKSIANILYDVQYDAVELIIVAIKNAYPPITSIDAISFGIRGIVVFEYVDFSKSFFITHKFNSL